MGKVVLAEKPSQAKEYAKVLDCTERKDGYYTGNGYSVTWTIGHAVSMNRPAEMSRKGLKLSDLPIIPDTWDFSVNEGKEKQFAVIENLFNDLETEEIICATDAGREGQHIFRLIYDKCGCDKPVKRLWVSSLTEESITKGFQDLRPNKEFENLAASAMSRAKADLLMGLNFSIAYSLHNSSKVQTGRVMTPTLAIVVLRELAIQAFKSKLYYEIHAQAKDGFKAKYVNSEGNHTIDDKAAADDIFNSIKDAKTGTVIKKEVKENKQKAPALYSISTLQMDGNKILGLTAAQTLEIAQGLYEKYKIISYPRTESNHLSTDMVDGLPEIIKSLPSLFNDASNQALSRIEEGETLGKAYVDNKKLTDHHAIIPTGKIADIDKLTMDERNVFLLISGRFLSIFLPDCINEITKYDLTIEDQIFKASGTVEASPGWKTALVVKRTGSSKEETLPLLNENDVVDITKIGLDKKNTKPPVRLNDSSLLKLMITAGKEVDDKEFASAMKKNGLGTGATRAGIIEKLVTIEYLNREKKNLVPTQKGMERIASEIEELKSPVLTGQWEQKLQLIEKGEYSADDFDKEIIEFVKTILPGVSQSKKLTVESFGQCPVCGKGEVIEGSKGFGCSQYPDCGFVVWKSICGKTISADQVRQLIETGKTSILEGFKNQEGKSFNAALIIKDGVVKFEYEKINCPVCKEGKVFESIKGFGCSHWKEGCKFFVFKTVAGKKLTPAQTKQLIEKGKTNLIKGFMSKKKKPFDAYLVLKDGKAEFEFQEKKKTKKKKNSRGGKK